jgi:uncharacterized protein (TIGR04255 family)
MALRFQKTLDRDTSLAPVAPQISVQVMAGDMAPPVPVPVEQPGQAWRLSARDGSTHVTLNATSLAVETTQYGTWDEHFQPWVTAAVNALAETADPGVVLRIGVRYVNALFGAALGRGPFTDTSDFRDVVVPSLLGFLADQNLGASVEAFQGRHLLKADDTITHVQHALATADTGEIGLLLDVDTYVEQTSEFKKGDILAVTERLHLASLAVFQHCITRGAWEAMEPVGREAQ